MSALPERLNTVQAGALVPAASQLRRKCACGEAASGLSGECEECRQEQGFGAQAKLAIGRADDPLELEADRAAAQVLDMAGSLSGDLTAVRPRISRRPESTPPAQSVPGSVSATLKRPGEPLPASTRDFFEPRFGHDFSRVRIHHDAPAAASARAVAAHAYTVSNHLVFAPGRYAPESPQGRRLLAHELAHVVQQTGTTARVQREDDKEEEKAAPATKKDVSIVLTDEDQDMDEGRTYAKTALRVTSVEDAIKQLKALKAPVGTLYVVSHSSSAGQIQFISGIGTISWVDIGELGKALKGQVTVDTVDFRGCKLGSAKGAMESFRKTAGAQSTKGSNCWTFIARVTPLTYEGAEVTKPGQIPKGMKKAFDKALLNQINGLQSDDGKPVKNCLLGLAAGQTAGARTLNKVWQQYWANSGNLIASWGSPEYNKNWQKGSICTNSMTATSKPCAIVETKAPAGAAKQGAAVVDSANPSPAVVEDTAPSTEELE